MASVVTSIGTDDRDYSTLSLWEAALGGAAGGAGNDAEGQAYNDSPFDEKLTVNDATPDSRVLTAAEGEEGDGTQGSGVSVSNEGSFSSTVYLGVPTTFKFFEVSVGGNNDFLVETQAACLLDSLLGRDSNGGGFRPRSGTVTQNCILYDNGSGVDGINTTNVYHCTVHSNTGVGITARSQDTLNTYNNIATSNGGAGFSNVDNGSNNCSSDETAFGEDSLTGVDADDIYISTLSGFEDLHEAPGVVTLNAGTPVGVTADIDGDARSSTAPDIGADERTGGPFPHHRRRLLTGGTVPC